MKRCTKCGEEKQSTDFYSHKVSKDGLQPYCKDCCKKYHQTEEAKEYGRKWRLKNRKHINKIQRDYVKTVRGKISVNKYRKSEKGKIAEKKKYEKYCNSEKGKIVRKRKDRKYKTSSKGKIISAKHTAKRKRELGFVLINSWFPGCNMHHLNETYVLAIPASLHRKYPHDHNDLKTMEEINHVAISWNYSY